MSEDGPSDKQKQQAKQYVFWTAVAVIVGYVVIFVV
jgi:hypothetical protein